MAAEAKLPHAYPFRLYFREEREADLFFPSSAGDWAGRGGPVPPWIVLEAFAQAAGLLTASDDAKGGVLVQVSRFRCPRPPLPGERWFLSGELLARVGPLLRVKVTARRGNVLAARAILTLREEKA